MPIGLNNDINNLGLLTGNIGTDYRNLINSQRGELRRIASPTDSPITTSASNLSSGIGFSYTPKNALSLVIISLNFSNRMSWQTSSTGYEEGFIKVYRDTSSVPTLSSSIPGTSTDIYSGLSSRHGVGYQGSGFWFTVSNSNILITDNSNTINTIYYYMSFSVSSSNGNFQIYTGSGQRSNYTILEYL
jgi:hypothetical protein